MALNSNTNSCGAAHRLSRPRTDGKCAGGDARPLHARWQRWHTGVWAAAIFTGGGSHARVVPWVCSRQEDRRQRWITGGAAMVAMVGSGSISSSDGSAMSTVAAGTRLTTPNQALSPSPFDATDWQRLGYGAGRPSRMVGPTAVCITGQLRTLLTDVVQESYQRNVMAALRAVSQHVAVLSSSRMRRRQIRACHLASNERMLPRPCV